MNSHSKHIIQITFLSILVVGCDVQTGASPGESGGSSTGQSYSVARNQMVEQQIKARGVSDEKVINAMFKVERHRFVPQRLRSYAYQDRPLPIGEGQTISQPYIVAFMTEILGLSKGDKILEIGTGSGYQAAILGEISEHVFTIEINEILGKRAQALLADLGYSQVAVKVGDGYQGWAEHAPFDAIIVTAAPSQIPQALKDQLKAGGRMIIPVGEAHDQKLVYLKKVGGDLEQVNIFPVRFVPLVDPSGKRY